MNDFWEDLIRRYGRKLLYLDTGAILSTLERGGEGSADIFASLIGWDFITSTYVVAETVRRIVKAKVSTQFQGPGGETRVALARYILKAWLEEHSVRVICIPQEVFDGICTDFHATNRVQCDLTDLVSYSIIRGLQQNQIASADGHFRDFGLVCLPGDNN